VEGSKYREKRVSVFKTGENQNLNIHKQHSPNSKRNVPSLYSMSAVLQASSIKNIFSSRTPVAAIKNKEHHTRFSLQKNTFKKKLDSLSGTGYFTFSGPQKEEWFRADSPYLLSKYKIFFILRLQMATPQSRIYEALIMLKEPFSFNPCQSNYLLTNIYLLFIVPIISF